MPERYQHDVYLGRFVVHRPFRRAGATYWSIRYRDLATGREHTVSSRQTTPARARRWATEYLAAIVDRDVGDLDRVRFSEAIDRWLESRAPDLAASTLYDLEVAVSGYRARFGRRWVDEVSGRDVSDYLAELARDRTPRTRRKHRSNLRRFFAWCRTRNHCAHDPTDGVEIPRGRRFEPRRLTVDEARRLVAALSESNVVTLTDPRGRKWQQDTASAKRRHLRLAVLVALYTGLRRGNVLGLEWRDVDLARGWIAIDADRMKARRRHRVPLHAVLADEFRGELRRLADRGVTPAPTDCVLGRRVQQVKGGFASALARAELPEKVRFHDLRGTCATWLRQRVPIDVVSAILAHTPSTVAGRHYVDIGDDALVAAIATLPDVRGDAAQEVARKNTEGH